MNNYYVYAYLDPRKSGKFIYNDLKFDYEPFYIGKGKDDRINYHLKCKGKNKHLNNKIKQIIFNNLIPIIIKIYDNLEEEKSYEEEGRIISLIGRRIISTGSLVNLHEGGRGKIGFSQEAKDKVGVANSNRKMPEEEKHRRSIFYTGSGNPMFGKNHSNIAKDKIAKAHRGTFEKRFGKEKANEIKNKLSKKRKGKSFHSENQIKILKNYMKTRIISDETKKKYSEAKSIKINYYIDNTLIIIFKNLLEAAEYFKVTTTAIHLAIKRCKLGKLYRKNIKLIQDNGLINSISS